MASSTVIQQELMQLDPEDIQPYPDVNPREHFDEDKQARLADNIAAQGGNIEPGVVTEGPGRPDGPDWWLVTGERRWRACRAKGLRFNAVFRPGLSYQEAIELAGIENLHRADLTAIEEARWFAKMIDPHGGKKTQAEVAEIRGVDQSTISNTLRLLELPDAIQDLIEQGKLAPTNARDLLLPWMKEDQAIREKFFRIVAQQLDFGVTTGQHMSKPWLKDMVERVGKIAKPAPAPKPAPAAKPAAKKETPAKKEPTEPKPQEEPTAEAGEAPGDVGAEEARFSDPEPAPAETDPAPVDEPADENVERQKAAAPPHQPVEVDFEVGVVGVAAQTLGDAIHHLTLTLQRHPSDAGQFFVTVLPKSQKGIPSGTGEQASGTAQTIDDQLREALQRFVAKLNREEK